MCWESRCPHGRRSNTFQPNHNSNPNPNRKVYNIDGLKVKVLELDLAEERVVSVWTDALPGNNPGSTLLDSWVGLLGQQIRVIFFLLFHTKARPGSTQDLSLV